MNNYCCCREIFLTVRCITCVNERQQKIDYILFISLEKIINYQFNISSYQNKIKILSQIIIQRISYKFAITRKRPHKFQNFIYKNSKYMYHASHVYMIQHERDVL